MSPMFLPDSAFMFLESDELMFVDPAPSGNAAITMGYKNQNVGPRFIPAMI